MSKFKQIQPDTWDAHVKRASSSADFAKEYKSLTVEDVSKMLNKAEISVQPRVSELKNDGLIEDSGKKSMGKWGTSITIWRLAHEE